MTTPFICQIYLQAAFNRLNKTEKQRKTKYYDRYPECIPLDPVPPIPKPLHESLRLGFVKSLLKNHKSRVPYVEVAQLPLVRSEGAALHDGVADLRAFLP
jgi:hypothetical protein